MRGAALSHARRVSSPTLASNRCRSTAIARPDSRPSLIHEKTMASPVNAALHSLPCSSAKTRSPPDERDLLRPDSLGMISVQEVTGRLARKGAARQGEMADFRSGTLPPAKRASHPGQRDQQRGVRIAV